MSEIKKMTRDEWMAQGKALFGEDLKQWRFKCPSCGHVQTGEDFIAAGIEKPEQRVFFSCIGRWLPGCDGEIGAEEGPCNYTSGGLFNLAPVRVLDGDHEISVFEFAESP